MDLLLLQGVDAFQILPLLLFVSLLQFVHGFDSVLNLQLVLLVEVGVLALRVTLEGDQLRFEPFLLSLKLTDLPGVELYLLPNQG